ncbi:MAG: GldG family protein [Saccharofermentans sp.]|nr:GldG family protein [Saccharofermentans sp.]
MNQNNNKKTVNKKGYKTSNVKNDSRIKTLKFYAIGSVVILVAIVVLLNILITSIFGDALTFDFSAHSQNSISQQTKDYINSLPENASIRIVGLFERPEDLQNSPYEYMVPLLDDYVSYSGGRITVEYKDPDLYPSIVSELDPNNIYNLQEGSYVVQYNGQIQAINPLDCFTIDQDYLMFYNAYLPTSNNVEYVFTNTISRLVSGFNKKAYIISGLKEEYSTSITLILNALGCEVEYLQVSTTFSIPDDCDLLILNGPKMDIPEVVQMALEDYLTDGGEFICSVDFTDENSSETYSNLNAVLNRMNINIDPYIIKENDVDFKLDDSGYNSLTFVNATFLDLSSDFEDYYQFRSSYIRPVRILNDMSDDYYSVAMSATSEAAICVKVADSGVTQYGDEGRFYTAVYSAANGTNSPAQVIVFGTNDFTSDDYISSYGMNDDNIVFFKGCVRLLLGSDANNTVEVPTRGISDYKLKGENVTATSATVVLVVFMVTIPLIFLMAAAVVYELRKNL